MLGFRCGRKSSQVAHALSDTPPSPPAGCWLSVRSVASEGGRRACQDSIEPDAPASGSVGAGCGVRRRGGDRDGRSAPAQGDLLGLRGAWSTDQGSARQALAAPGSRCQPVLYRVRAAPAALPCVWREGGDGGVGARRIGVHPRFRGSHGVVGAADGKDADHQAAADWLGVCRQDRRASGGRPSR